MSKPINRHSELEIQNYSRIITVLHMFFRSTENVYMAKLPIVAEAFPIVKKYHSSPGCLRLNPVLDFS